MKKLAILTVFLSVTYNLLGQSPQKMSYQCVVRNNNNLVMNQPVGMKITILQGSPTGTVVYQEIYNPNPQTNINGLVTLDIGTGIPISGTFSSINWAAGPFFLKTEADPAGGTNYIVTGTTQLLSVPYALYASVAGNGFSGNYNDLANKPILFDGTWLSLTGKPLLATIATSGSYTDLLNKPTLFSGSYNDLTNKPALFDGTFTSLTGKPTTLSGYGITNAMTTAHAANNITTGLISNWNTAFGWGNHAGLYKLNSYVPTWAEITSKPTFAAIATSGTFADLLAKPTTLLGYGITDAMNTLHPAYGISPANITNWTSAFSWGDHAIAGYAKYPSQTGNSGRYLTTNGTATSWAALATVAVTGSYNDLTNKPTFDGTFAGLTGKPTTISGYGITDAMTTAHAANNITSGLISNWNTAYGWGNHASAGYVPGTRTITINGNTLNLTANNTWNVGTVTSVGMSLPGIFTVSGSPVTSLGTLSATLASQTANMIFASPNGTTGAPVFRSLVSADLPNIDWSKITTGKPTTLSGYGITDAISTSHAASIITPTLINNWNTAYSWGNHAGLYKQFSYVPNWVEITSKPTTLSGYGITNAMSTSHAANNITVTNITNWNTAYGWGNHSGLYKLNSYVPNWVEITNKPTTITGYEITDAVSTTGDQTIAGNKTFIGTTTVATPLNPSDAATKAYVDMLKSQIEELQILAGIRIKDIDGNSYKTVTIGMQVWMSENLKTTRYNDGTNIPNITVDATWGALTTGAYCDYSNNPSNSTIYGRLYNWYAIDNNAPTKLASNGGKNVCPIGWHVPSDVEWTTLTDYLTNNGYGYQGSGSDIAKSMAASSGWTTHTLAGTVGNDQASNNSSGFTALPSGSRAFDGVFNSFGTYGRWWGSSQNTVIDAYARIIFYGLSSVLRSSAEKTNGLSIRCIKD